MLELRKITNGITGIAQFRFTQESYHDMRVELVRDPMDAAYTKEEIEAFSGRSCTISTAMSSACASTGLT